MNSKGLATRTRPRQTLVVGDLHGCLDELEQLLTRVGFEESSGDRLISVGDLVHKGPHPGATLRRFIDRGYQAVLGNHDAHMLRALRGDAARYPELDETIADSGLPEALLREWLEALPLWLEEPGLLVVHAGLDPRFEHPRQMNPDLLMNIRGWLPQGGRPGSWQDEPWFRFWADHKLPDSVIVFGHWARLGALREGRFRALDSGCCYGGSLTGYLVEEDELVAVVSKQPRAFAPA